MVNADFEVSKRYTISGVEVLSEIVKDEDTPEYRAFHIRSSCPSSRWGTRTLGYSLTCYKNPKTDSSVETLEKYRQQQAERIVKIESGELPEDRLSFLGIQIQGPTGKTINTIASPDLSVSPSLLGIEIIRSLELVPTERNSFQEQIVSVPLFKATISYGPLKVETRIAASEHGAPACILGGDFFQKALKGKESLIQELVMPDHYRVLANAARCKKRYVLIVGKYGEHRSRLEKIKQKLATQGFIGLILDEYPDIEEQSLPEKMVTYASICRFVLVDDFALSGHNLELAICHERKFVAAVLRSQGRATTAMQTDIGDEVSFLKVFKYESDAEIEGTVTEAATWANEAVNERAKRLNRDSDWRGPDKIMGI
jgi:hypothetical protein